MRVTVTIDSDIAVKLKTKACARGLSFDEALNSSLRRGLESENLIAKPYRVPTRPMGAKPGVNLDKALRLADP